MAPMKRYSLAGIKTPAGEGDLPCSACRGKGAPAIVLLEAANGGDHVIRHRLCLPCVGRACELATGWRIMRAWSQWLASSLQSATLKPQWADDTYGEDVSK